MEGFTSLQASRFTGTTGNQLRYWDKIGLVKPGVQATGGRPGVRRLYSFRDLIALKVVKSLLDGGMSLQRVRRAYAWLRENVNLDDHLSSVKLVTDGKSIFKILKGEGEILDALRQDEFAPIRARVKALFDPGGLAVSLVRRVATEEEARELALALSRAGGLEEHRRGTVREALFMKYPSLRAPAANFLYATPGAIEARRDELARLKQVELPANAEAMKAAKEHGDLSENFEYHAARQKHEYLSARIAALADQLSRTRALDPSRIDVSEVRVGTRVLLRTAGRETAATILGPWDSRPEEGVYSYESEFAAALLGKRVGESVRSAEGEPAVIVSITPWR